MELVLSVTEIAAIVTMITAMITIAVSIQRIFRWWRNRRKSPNETKPRLQGFYKILTEDSKKSRQGYEKILTQRGRSIAEQEKIDITDLLPLDDTELLTDSAIQSSSLPSDSFFVDAICTALTREGRTILILPSGRSHPDVEGVGRTSVLLRLLGIRIHYGRLIGLSLEELSKLELIPLDVQSERQCNLLCTDLAFLGSSGRKLSLVPTKGEKMSFLWDLSRHIYRTTELGYKTGDHRKDPGRQKLLEIFKKIQYGPLSGVFGNIGKLYPVDEVVLLRKDNAPELRPPEQRELKGEERIAQLREGLLVSIKHGSDFWRKNKKTLESYADQIVDALDMARGYSVSEISYSYPETAVPSHYYDQIAEIIKTRENLKAPVSSEQLFQIRGIAAHNNILSRSLCDVDKVRLLVTSGEKIFNERNFWEDLFQVKRRTTVKILMLNPESLAVKQREKEAYADKSAGFLTNEIRENIDTIRRMQANYDETAKPVEIVCATYDEMPSFRMTFIGTQKLLFASYERYRRTGKETIFYEVDSQKMEGIVEGFDLEYKRIEAQSRIVERLK